MTHGIGLLLLSAVAGYWVLERASSHKGELQRVGRLLGTIVIVMSLIGIGCAVASMASGMVGCNMGYGPMGKPAMAGRSCPFTSRMKPGVASAIPTPSTPQKMQKEH